jgi:FHA domain/TIR domain
MMPSVPSGPLRGTVLGEDSAPRSRRAEGLSVPNRPQDVPGLDQTVLQPMSRPRRRANAWLQTIDADAATYSLDNAPLRIGRHSSSHIVIDDKTVSRQHAIVQAARGDRHVVLDVGSTSGVFVNGARVDQAILADGDLIELGVARLRYLRNGSLDNRPLLLDSVDCSVMAPATAMPGSTFMVQVFLHLDEQKGEVQAVAQLYDDQASLRGIQTLLLDVTRGTLMTILLDGDGLVVEQPTARVRWAGQATSATFRATVPRNERRRRLIPTARVLIDGVPVGHVSFTVDVDDAATRNPSVTRGHRYRRAFTSYASRDRPEVLKRLQMLKPAGIEFFNDIIDLDAGQRWQQELWREIDRCDLFFLFWSEAASNSEWVLRELQYAAALQRRSADGLPFICPIVVEKAAPPPGFDDIHFNDVIAELLAVRST